MKISGTGKFTDAAADELCRSLLMTGQIRQWQGIMPSFGVFQGLFQITSMQYSGPHDKEITYQMSLESGGEIGWTAS